MAASVANQLATGKLVQTREPFVSLRAFIGQMPVLDRILAAARHAGRCWSKLRRSRLFPAV